MCVRTRLCVPVRVRVCVCTFEVELVAGGVFDHCSCETGGGRALARRVHADRRDLPSVPTPTIKGYTERVPRGDVKHCQPFR